MSDQQPWRITVHQHGARRHPTGATSSQGFPQTAYPDLTPGGLEQLWLAHQMRNMLVEMDHQYEERVIEIWATVPQVAAVQEQVAACATEVEQVLELIKADDKSRGKAKADPDLRARMKTARAALKAAKVDQRAIKDLTYTEIEPKLIVLREWRRLRTKEIRQDFAKQGLYWATYNACIEHHQTSAKNIIRKRKAGEPAAHRFHRWQRDGTLAVQLQRQSTDPARSPEMLASGEGPWRNVVQIKPYVDPQTWAAMTKAERREIMKKGEVVFRVSSGETISIPIKLSRMLPTGADITGVQVSRRSQAGSHKLSVAVSARVPVTPVRDTGPAVALHIGWRVRPDDSIRVGTIVSTEELVVPSALAGTVVSYGHWAEVLFPAAWRKEFSRVDEIRSQRDRELDKIKAVLVQYLTSGADLHEEVTVASVKAWRSQASMAKVVLAVRAKKWDRPLEEVVDPAYAVLEEALISWYRWDKRQWQLESGSRQRLIRRRQYSYRQVAAWLGKTARIVVIDNIDLGALARIKSDDDHQIAAARANRFLVAPADLRSYMTNAAVNHGAELLVGTPVAGRLVHYTCGKITSTPEEYISQPGQFCSVCNHGYDQDANMGLLMLSEAGEIEPVPESSAQ
jgi:hypothetical protein